MADVLVMTSTETAALLPILEEEGHVVRVAQTAGDLIAEVMRHQLDVVVIPDNDETVEGVELLSVLRRLTSELVVVVGEGTQDRVAMALLQGADLYLPNPLASLHVVSRLNSLLRRGQPHPQAGSEESTEVPGAQPQDATEQS